MAAMETVTWAKATMGRMVTMTGVKVMMGRRMTTAVQLFSSTLSTRAAHRT